MLRTITITRSDKLAVRLVGIAAFTILTALSAKISLEVGAVPFTLQVLVVLLSGMVLGARDGAGSQLAYLSLLMVGLPFDARGLGTAAFVGPTAGYLIAFVPAAFVAGWLVEKGACKLWQRWVAGVAGIAVIYALGVVMLKAIAGLDWGAAWAAGVAPFLAADLVKALLAATLVESARSFLLRSGDPVCEEKAKK